MAMERNATAASPPRIRRAIMVHPSAWGALASRGTPPGARHDVIQDDAILVPFDGREHRLDECLRQQVGIQPEVEELHVRRVVVMLLRLHPRVESEEHYYNPAHMKLLDLGLDPHLLSQTLIESMFSAIERHKDRVILDHIMPSTRWRPPARERTPR